MLSPIFSRSHRIPWAHDVPQTPTNTERMQAYRAIAPVQFGNTVFNPRHPRRQSEAAAARGALADGDFLYGVNAQADALEVVSRIPGRSRLPRRNAGKPEISTGHPTHSPLTDEQPRRAALPNPAPFDPDAPTPEEVAEAYAEKYGLAQEAG